MFEISYLKISDLMKCLKSDRNVRFPYYFLSYSLQTKLQYTNFVSNVTNFQTDLIFYIKTSSEDTQFMKRRGGKYEAIGTDPVLL